MQPWHFTSTKVSVHAWCNVNKGTDRYIYVGIAQSIVLLQCNNIIHCGKPTMNCVVVTNSYLLKDPRVVICTDHLCIQLLLNLLVDRPICSMLKFSSYCVSHV